VLWETSCPNSNEEWQLSGLTETYVRVNAVHSKNIWNRISTVKVSRHDKSQSFLWGKVISSNPKRFIFQWLYLADNISKWLIRSRIF